MRILYLDFLYPKSHLELDINNIKRISSFADLYVVSPKGRYKNLPSNINLIEQESIRVKNGTLQTRLSSLKTMYISSKIAKKIKPDYIFVSSFETMAFSIGNIFFRQNRILLLHHFNIDELGSRVKRLLFDIYKDKVNHVVFSDFMRNHLIKEHNILKNKIHVIPHHMIINSKNGYVGRDYYMCVGLSNSNDETIITEIANKERDQMIFKKNNIKIMLKSKNTEFDNGYLRIVKGFIEKDKYEDIINSSKSLYLPFPSSFCYRMSGTLIQSLSNSKKVCGSNILLMREYATKYPQICKVINNVDEFFDYVLFLKKTDDTSHEEEFKMFKEDHSNHEIEVQIKNAFDNFTK